jgi:hypothetical protein
MIIAELQLVTVWQGLRSSCNLQATLSSNGQLRVGNIFIRRIVTTGICSSGE